ncbi:FtsX-like permease family protein [Streptomyces sp. NPDC127190]|uniref:FtsX-like permease family protein n=1 Tax=unclassified Streptomyces TaxID=2593676 RepID=UPI003644B202
MEFLLGLRLLLGSGRGNRARFALMVVGVSIGVCCLAIVLTIPGMLAAQDARVAARQLTSAPPSEADAYPRGLERTDPYDSRPLTRIFLARGAKSVTPPPGLTHFPERGDFYVSPRLHELLRKDTSLAQRLPGRERGIVGPQGLARPGELVAFVGIGRDQLRDGYALSGFGHDWVPPSTLEPPALDMLRYTMSGAVLLPLVVFLSVCARLSAAERARRLAALRLLGMSAKDVRRVNATETVVAAWFGAVLGLGEYWILNQLGARVGLPGFTWYPSDGALSGSTLFTCLVGCPVLAWFVGRASARNAVLNPLAARRNAVAKAPSSLGFLPLLAGTGIAAAYCIAGALGYVPQETATYAVLIPTAAVLTGIGLVTALPALCSFTARWIADSTRSLTLGLAMRRNEAEPGGALRVAAGLVLLVFAVSLVQGVLIDMDRAATTDFPVLQYDLATDQFDAAGQQALARLPHVRAHIVTASAERVGASDAESSSQLVVATCAQLRAVVSRVDKCVDGQPLRLSDPEQPGEDPVHGRLVIQMEGHRRVEFTAPERILRYRDQRMVSVFESGSILVPPAMLPKGVRPAEAFLTLLSDSGPQTVRRVFDGIGRVAPTAEVTVQGVNTDALQAAVIVRTLLCVGMVLGLVIGVAAYMVAVIDRILERRSHITALTLLGARARTMRAVQVAQVVMPLAVGLVLAVITGKLVESSYLTGGGEPVLWDSQGLPLLLIAALALLLIAALGSFPLLGRRIDPELIRRD